MSPLLILVSSLVVKNYAVGELKKAENFWSFQLILRGGNSNSTAIQEPYKRIAIKNFKDSRKYLVDGALACITDPNCLSFDINGDHLLMYKCSKEAFSLKSKYICVIIYVGFLPYP